MFDTGSKGGVTGAMATSSSVVESATVVDTTNERDSAGTYGNATVQRKRKRCLFIHHFKNM